MATRTSSDSVGQTGTLATWVVICVPMLTVRLRARHMPDIDDDWGNMNKNGPSEMNGNAMEDMGLGPADLAEIVPA